MTTSTYYLCLQFLCLMTICQSSLQDVALNFNTASKEYEMKMSQGKNTFLELISKGTFVDKTLLIDAFIRHPKEYLVLIRPSDWGKTINLDMLRMFFEMPLYPNGTRILPISSTPNYRLFKEGKYYSNGYNITLKRPLLISQPEYWNHSEEHLGQYPVIHWSFDDIPLSNDTNEKAIVAEINKKVYDQHKYLPIKYDHWCEGSFGIPNLISRLNNYFKKKAVVLVDCYDRFSETPILRSPGEIDLLLSWCTKSTHYNNTQKTMYTGIERRDYYTLHYPNMFHGISPFQNLYGFTSTEMSLIYNHYSITRQEQNLIQYWYGGYKLYKMEEEIFHPSATCSYLNTHQFKSFFLNKKYDSHMKKLMNIKQSLFVFTSVISGGATFTCCNLSTAFLDCDNPPELKSLLYGGYFIGLEWRHYEIPNFRTAIHLQNTLTSALFDHSWSTLLNETCAIWDWFLLNDEITSHKLQINLNKCHKLLCKYYETIIKTTPIGPISNLVKAQKSVVISIMPSKKLHFVGWHYSLHSTYDDRLNETNILLSCGDRGIFINIRKDKDEINVVSQSSRYIQMFKLYAEFHEWKYIKFVDCKLLPYDKLQIHATVRSLNSTS